MPNHHLFGVDGVPVFSVAKMLMGLASMLKFIEATEPSHKTMFQPAGWAMPKRAGSEYPGVVLHRAKQAVRQLSLS